MNITNKLAQFIPFNAHKVFIQYNLHLDLPDFILWVLLEALHLSEELARLFDHMSLGQVFLNCYWHRVVRALAKVHQVQIFALNADKTHFELLWARSCEALIERFIVRLGRFGALSDNLLFLRGRRMLVKRSSQLNIWGLCSLLSFWAHHTGYRLMIE